MNTQTTSEYMLLFRGTDWTKGLSPEEIQNIATAWRAWFERLTREGKAKAGQPLAKEGKIVSGKHGRVVVDGPFAESKEAIGGYFLLQVDSLERAVAMARVHGPAQGRAAAETIRRRGKLDAYYLLYAVLGEFEPQFNHPRAAAYYFRESLGRTRIESEQRFLSKRIPECESQCRDPSPGIDLPSSPNPK